MWKYKGDVLPMIDNIQWTFVVEKLMHEDKHRMNIVMSDSDACLAAAKEFGMTRYAVAKEMIRLGRKAICLLDELAEDDAEE